MSVPDPACIVVGSGPVGLAAALALARAGVAVTLVGPAAEAAPPDRQDRRTAALFNGSLELLKSLGLATEALGAEPLRAIRMIDDRGGLLRAPETLFSAEEVGLQAFGANVPNASLVAGLARLVADTGLRIVRNTDALVTAVTPGDRHVTVTLSDGRTISAALVVAADGRRSIARAAAGVHVETWDYDQTAIVCAFDHVRPHRGISNELHRSAGPLTTVPMPGAASSLVWVERPAIARRLGALDDASFAKALEQHLRGLLGAIGAVGPRALLPLTGLRAAPLGARRIALAGEAAHALSPLGAQGLNLSLRDVAALAELAGKAVAGSADIGAPSLLAAYGRARSGDIQRRTAAVNFLNDTLTSELQPFARGLGLHVLNAVPALKRAVMRAGL